MKNILTVWLENMLLHRLSSQQLPYTWIFYFVTGLENIIQCILSVKVSVSQIFLFDSQAWKHDAIQIVTTAIIKCLNKMYFFCFVTQLENVLWSILSVTSGQQIFLFEGQAWKHFSMEIIGYSNIYNCCTSIILLSENIFLFHGSAWKRFAVFIIRQSSLLVRLKNMISGKQKVS